MQIAMQLAHWNFSLSSLHIIRTRAKNCTMKVEFSPVAAGGGADAGTARRRWRSTTPRPHATVTMPVRRPAGPILRLLRLLCRQPLRPLRHWQRPPWAHATRWFPARSFVAGPGGDRADPQARRPGGTLPLSNRWPEDGWVRGTVAARSRAAGFSHVVRYGRTSALAVGSAATVVHSLLDAATSHGPWPADSIGWVLLRPAR
jgi:hypothetical protein